MLNNIAALVGASTAAVGDFESIQTYTVGAGGQASIDFTSIGTDWKHLQIRGISRSTDSGQAYSQTKLTINGVITNYTLHQIEAQGTGSAGAYALTGQANTLFECTTGDAATASIYGVTIIDILDYQSTNKYKTFRILAGYDANGSGRMGFTSGMTTTNTNAVTSVTLAPRFGNFKQYTSFALYGIK
jgi:hypothetical protein